MMKIYAAYYGEVYMVRWGNVNKDYKAAFIMFSIFKTCAHGMCI